MKEIDKIIKSTTPPKSKDVLWDNGKELLINRNGNWESVSGSKVNSVTPDWNADEGESGYIENRTHYIYYDYRVTVDLTNVKAGDVIKLDGIVVYYRANNGSDIIHIEPDKEFSFDINGPSIRAIFTYENNSFVLKILSNSVGIENIVELFNGNIHQINDIYIPDTIARTADYEALEARIAELEAKVSAITVTIDE